MQTNPALLSAFLLLIACKSNDPAAQDAQFASQPTAAVIQSGTVDEASGLADSRSQPGNVWIQEDSGNPAELSLLGYDGTLKGRLTIPNTTNRDWEDLASGPGPQAGINYLYIGEIGDNDAVHDVSYVYRLPEPASVNGPVGSVDKISFRYPDGPRDAEALILDPQTKDIWIVSKRESNVHLYQLPYPQSTTETITATAYGELPLSYVTGGAISSDGSEVILRTYLGVYYWKRKSGQLLADALQKQSYRQLPYRIEPQGEGICFEKDNKGYFTVSERNNMASTSLYYYARK